AHQLSCSDTHHALVLGPAEIAVVDDLVRRGSHVDDGVAYCGPLVMRRIARAVRPGADVPCAAQVRIVPFKGMLVVDPTIAGVKIPVGNLKFDADQAGDAAWRVVDVCHFAEIRPGPQALSAANLRNVVARGVPVELLRERQRGFVEARAAAVSGAARGGDGEASATARLDRKLVRQYERACAAARAAGAPAGAAPLGDEERLGAMIRAGVDPREPMRQELGVRVLERDLRAACGRVSGGAKKPAFRLFLDDSLRARLVPDRAGVLGDGECYLSVDGVPREGYVLVMRDPSYFSACVRVLRCVGAAPRLQHLDGVLVLAAARADVSGSEAERMSGGDYDGDEALVVYDEAIVDAVRDRDAAIAAAGRAGAAPAPDGAPRSCLEDPLADGWSHDPAKARASKSVVGVLFDDLRRLVPGLVERVRRELPEPARDPALVLLDGPKDLVDLARETEKRWNNGTRDALKSAEQRRLEATEAAKKDAALADGLDAALKLVDDDLRAETRRLRREARVALGLEQPEVAVFDALHALRAARCAYTCVDWFFQREADTTWRAKHFVWEVAGDFLLDYKLTIKNRYGVYVQSDSRAPSDVAPAKRNESWWWASAALTARQAARHGDRYVHYRVPPTGCVAADGLTELTAPWCKVKAMLQAMDDFPDAAVFLYLDSDAAVSPAYANRSLVALGDFVAASVAARTPGFGDESRPVALSRDGHGHWCVTLWKRRKLLPHHWDACLNAGVIIWRRDVLGRARDFFERWWALAATCAATCCDHFPDAHRVWPWEQTGLQYVAADGKDVAAAVPVYEPAYPAARHLVWPPKIRYKACPVPWCLSHVPGACCVVDHHCAGRRDKFALAARALRERARAAPASAALRLVDRRHSVLDDHGLEIALSATRYAELAINNGRRADALAELRGAEAYLASTTSNGFQASVNVRLKAEHMVKMARFVANAIPDFPPLNVSHVSPKRLRDTVDSLRQGNQELGHVHVWSHATLVDYLLAAEKAVPDDAHFVALAAEVCGMPYGPAQPLDDAPHTEYRIVLQRAIPRREGPRSEPDGSRGPHVDLGKRWIVMAALSRRYQAGHARAWPVLLPARDHAGGSPGSRFPPADLADLFPKKRADGRPARWADPPPRGRQRGPLAGIPNPILPGGGLHPAYAKLDISPVEMEPPHVLFLMVDSMDGRVVDPTSPVSSRVALPFLESLAKEGINFARTYTPAPQCVPGRAAMLTGLRTDQCRAFDNGNGIAAEPSGAVDATCASLYDEKTCGAWAADQKHNGSLFDGVAAVAPAYDLAVIGKIDMGANAMQRHGNTPNVTWGTGFHSGPSLPIVTRAADVRKPTKPNPMAITNDDNDHVHPEDWVAIDNCDAWLRNRDSDAPFFLHCSLNIPHPSFETNATWLKAVNWTGAGKGDWIDVDDMHPYDAYESSSKAVAGRFSDDDVAKVQRTYYAMCAEADFLLGRVGDVAKARGFWDDALVVFTSDHGEMNMEHRQVWKNSMYEASARVPLILGGGALPAGLKRGSVETGLATLLDIFPTMMDFLGAPNPQKPLPG
ncbi:hypothetical protein AURANDRAFT_68689, partial [Aureococcus anophagefferens]